MGKIFHHTPSTIVRITLVSLAVAAERVRFLAEREEIEVDDLPPPTIPPTLTKVKAGVSGYTNGYVMRPMRLAQLLENVRKTLRLRGSDRFRLDSPQLHQEVAPNGRGFPAPTIPRLLSALARKLMVCWGYPTGMTGPWPANAEMSLRRRILGSRLLGWADQRDRKRFGLHSAFGGRSCASSACCGGKLSFTGSRSIVPGHCWVQRGIYDGADAV
jgi:hypothetical protein